MLPLCHLFATSAREVIPRYQRGPKEEAKRCFRGKTAIQPRNAGKPSREWLQTVTIPQAMLGVHNRFVLSWRPYETNFFFFIIVGKSIIVLHFVKTEKFIEQYKGAISPDNSDVVINYCYARLAFNKGEFEKALWHLNAIKTIRHIQYKLPVRDLTLMTFYELDMLNQSAYQIDSYRHFLNNNKGSLSEERFTRILNFLKFYTRLLKIKEKRSMKEIVRLKEDIESTGNTLEKFWLLKKTGELTDE